MSWSDFDQAAARRQRWRRKLHLVDAMGLLGHSLEAVQHCVLVAIRNLPSIFTGHGLLSERYQAWVLVAKERLLQ